MKLFDRFSAEFFGGFVTNNIYTLSQIKSKLENNSMTISIKNNNYFIQECDFLNYFIKENKKIEISKSKVRIFYENTIDDKNLEFMELNNFSIREKYFYMSISEVYGTKYNKISINHNDINAIYAFLEKYFKGLIYFSKNELYQKLIKGEIIYKKENEQIAGMLIYSKGLSGVYLDYIAVDKEVAKKDLAFKLMKELATRCKNINLLVRNDNQRAISFYERFGFKRVKKNMNIYTNEWGGVVIVGVGRVAKAIYDIVKKQHLNAIWCNGKEGDEYFNALSDCFIISANNMYIFKKPCIQKNFIINYHNSLMPRHCGLNAAMWAIYSGDKYSGVCWHLVECGIDTGVILAKKRIEITQNMNSLELLKIQADIAISAFKEVFEKIKIGQIVAMAQGKKGASYHGKELPNGSRLNLGWNFDKISRFLRSFACIINKPKVRLNGKWCDIINYKISQNSIYIKCQNLSIRIENEKN